MVQYIAVLLKALKQAHVWMVTGCKNNETSSVMESHSNVCQLLTEIAVWFHHASCVIAF